MAEVRGHGWKLAAKVIFTTPKGQQHFGRVVDASPSHVTVHLYDAGSIRLVGDDIAGLSQPTASQRRDAPLRFW